MASFASGFVHRLRCLEQVGGSFVPLLAASAHKRFCKRLSRFIGGLPEQRELFTCRFLP